MQFNTTVDSIIFMSMVLVWSLLGGLEGYYRFLQTVAGNNTFLIQNTEVILFVRDIVWRNH